MKKNPTVLFLVRAFAKLQRERSYFCPRLFREGGGLLDGQAEAREKEPVIAARIFGNKLHPCIETLNSRNSGFL